MNAKVISLVVMTAIAICMIVLAAAQPTPYMTFGYIRKGDGNPCNK